MAGNFNKALGNTMIKKVAQTSSRNANVPKIEYIDIDLLDENPDNEQIFNMDGIERLKQSIQANGFTGAVEVFKKPDGRYEISSGHRRVRALKELGRDRVPCLVNSLPDDIVRAKRLLDSNITNRVLGPLDYARSIEYYIDYILKPSGFKGQTNRQCAKYFDISPSMVYKYRALTKTIPELQELSNDPRVPFTGLTSAYRLSSESQKKLADEIKDKLKETDGTEEGGDISRSYITGRIKQLLKDEDRYLKPKNENLAKKKETVKEDRAEVKPSDAQVINDITGDKEAVSPEKEDDRDTLLPDNRHDAPATAPATVSDKDLTYITDIMRSTADMIAGGADNAEIKRKLRFLHDEIEKELKRL